MKVEVIYFGMLGAQAGVHAETVTTDALTLEDLFAERASALGIALPVTSVRAAMDDEFRDWSTSLEDGASIGFMPPFCGG